MNSIPLTKHGANLLKKELNYLKKSERPSIISQISEARAHGDLSENSEYNAAKERQSFIEGRITDIENKLNNALIIDPLNLDAEGRVVFAATIDLENLETNEKVTYQIVGIDEANIKESKISITSPIARALIGKMSGDIIFFKSPLGLQEYKILKVSYI